ncbi:ABC transporter permease [Flaviaesturariibacter amylovorans]|uniref:ABC transmembrane type-1 domain-containing protein n=1 Tax=Flaviaesturariibacter amylovorans TaxID=1084520 RepID=A0ABP8HPU1_9BACT
MNDSTVSFSQALRRRLLRNKGALFGMVLIGLAVLVAVFGYFLAPDPSPNANRIILEIGGNKPGYTQEFLLLRKNPEPAPVGFFERLLNGVPDRADYIPVTWWRYQGDSLLVDKYVDEGLTERRSYVPEDLAGKSATVRQRFLLGTDKYGRDILSRLIIGTRVSLTVGLVTVLISLSIGIFLGALAGYFGGKTDAVVMWLINVLWSIPTLLLVFAITLLLGKGFWQVFIAVGLTLWVNVARLVRGQVLATRELSYVEAARALGYSHFRTLFRHILPNILGPILVIAASNFASAIVIEAGLSFLGVGVQPPQPSWGLMIKENYNFIITNNPVLALAPGFAIMLLVLAFHLLGNGLRDALDVRG